MIRAPEAVEARTDLVAPGKRWRSKGEINGRSDRVRNGMGGDEGHLRADQGLTRARSDGMRSLWSGVSASSMAKENHISRL